MARIVFFSVARQLSCIPNWCRWIYIILYRWILFHFILVFSVILNSCILLPQWIHFKMGLFSWKFWHHYSLVSVHFIFTMCARILMERQIFACFVRDRECTQTHTRTQTHTVGSLTLVTPHPNDNPHKTANPLSHILPRRPIQDQKCFGFSHKYLAV